MIVDGAGAVQAHDKSGEVLHIDGIDTTSVKQKHCALSWEHITDKRKNDQGEMVPNEGHTALDIVGRVTYAHKILSKADCENDRQRMYWEKIGFPFLYIIGRLFDGAGHPAAMALAAILRDGVANDEPPLCEYSIEGHTLERDGNELLQTVMRKVTFTVKPCNALATSGILEDPNAPRGYDEHPGSKDDDAEDALAAIRDIKKGESLDVRIGGHSLQIDPVLKTYDAGMATGAPGTLTGGAALQREEISGSAGRSKKLAALAAAAAKHYDADKHGPLRKYLATALAKMQMPEISDEFLDHYADLVENHLRLSRRALRKAEELAKKEKCPPGHSLNRKTGEYDAVPEDLLVASKEAYRLQSVAEKSGTKADWVAAMHAFDAVGQKAIRLGFDNWGDEHKGQANDCWEVEHDLRKDEPAPDVKPPKAPKAPKSVLTFRGQPVKPNPELRNGKFEFDEDQGVLRTQHGTFHLYNPDHDPHHAHAGEAFRASLASPEVAKIHDYAMQQWLRLHEALKAGTLPQAVLGTAVAFSHLSPRTPVPLQEFVSSHLFDTAHQHQIEIHDPRFGGLKEDFLGRDHPTKLPEHSRDYFQTTLKPALTLGSDSDTSGRKAGELPAFGLAPQQFDRIAQYAGVHDQFVQTVRRHGVDARAAVGDLMNAKVAKLRWNVHRQNRLAHGQTDPGPYEGAPVINGLAQKTARFAYAMLGAGNSLVPDTHMVRFLFGLDGAKDGATIDYLKKRVIWQPKNTALLNAIDRWYFHNHPAVQYMRDHPEFGRNFRIDPQQAVFGAFWRNWLAIGPTEREIGLSPQISNALATHRPYFEEAQRHFADPNAKPVGKPTPFARVQKAESVPGGPLIDPADAAELLHDWTQQLGHVGAMIRYYAHLVPLLYPDESLHPGVNLSSLEKSLPIEAAMVEIRKAQIDLRRALGEDLAKADGDSTQAARKKIPSSVPQQPGGGAVKKPAAAAPPRPKWDGKVDAMVHGSAVHNTTPAQHDLIHGVNLRRPVAGPAHENMAAVNEPSWHKSPKAGLVIVKDDHQVGHDPSALAGVAHHEVTYHNAMRDVLGLGKFVPTTASFHHPETGMHTSVQQAVPQAEHAEIVEHNAGQPAYTTERMKPSSSAPESTGSDQTTNPYAGKPTRPERELVPHQAAWLKKHADSGDLDKMAMANKILGNYDRHFGNFLFSAQAPHVRLIDHSHTFQYGGWDDSHPAYFRAAGFADPKFANQPVHPAAASWIAGLNPETLRQHLLDQGHDEATANNAAHRVKYLQAAVRRGHTRADLMEGTGYSRPPAILPRPEYAK